MKKLPPAVQIMWAEADRTGSFYDEYDTLEEAWDAAIAFAKRHHGWRVYVKVIDDHDFSWPVYGQACWREDT